MLLILGERERERDWFCVCGGVGDPKSRSWAMRVQIIAGKYDILWANWVVLPASVCSSTKGRTEGSWVYLDGTLHLWIT